MSQSCLNSTNNEEIKSTNLFNRMEKHRRSSQIIIKKLEKLRACVINIRKVKILNKNIKNFNKTFKEIKADNTNS